jgi:ATP-dependent protease HslVU (ClpYQ) peptidase subunit
MEAGGAVIEITETRKLTKTEIRNFKVQHASDLELLSSLESSIEDEACDGLEQKEVDNSKHDSSDSELEHSEELQTFTISSTLASFSSMLTLVVKVS